MKSSIFLISTALLIFIHTSYGCSECGKLVFDESFCPTHHICTDQLNLSNDTCSASCTDSIIWINHGMGWHRINSFPCDLMRKKKEKKEKKSVKYVCSVKEGCTKCSIPNLLMTLPDSSNFAPIDNMKLTPTNKEGLCTQLQCDQGYKLIARSPHGSVVSGIEDGIKCDRLSRWGRMSGSYLPPNISVGCIRESP